MVSEGGTSFDGERSRPRRPTSCFTATKADCTEWVGSAEKQSSAYMPSHMKTLCSANWRNFATRAQLAGARLDPNG